MAEVLKKYKLSPDSVSLNQRKSEEIDKETMRSERQERLLALDKVIQSRVSFLEEKIQLEKEQAYRSGFEDGREMEKGRREEEQKRVIQLFLNLIENLKKQREEFLRSAEKELIRLSLKIAAKIIHQKIELDEKLILRNLRQALRLLLDKSRIVIRLSPADLETVNRFSKELQSVEGLQEVILEEDSNINRGGCLILSELGNIDARIETQLELIEKKLINTI